jgi:transposase
MIHRRQFTAEFTAQVVLELLSGAKSSAELCREHQLASSVRADWKAHFLARAASLFKSPDQRDHQDATRVAELERVVGRLTLENDILQKATNLLHSHAKRRGRLCRCSANTIRSASSAGCSGAHGAATMTTRDAVTKRRSRPRSRAARASGPPMTTGESRPSDTVNMSSPGQPYTRRAPHA